MATPSPPLLWNSSYAENPFTSLEQAQAVPGEELRFDDIQHGDLYHGRATDAAATADPVWEVVRFYRDTVTAKIERARYVRGIAWDDRTNPANWP